MRLIQLMLAASLLIAVPSHADESGITHNRDIVEYEFDASSYAKVGNAMDDASPFRSERGAGAGKVEGAWDLNLSPAVTETSCGVADVNMTLTTTITLPAWRNLAQQSNDDKRRWASYREALELFQEGHVDIHLARVRAIRERLLALPAEADCDALSAAAAAAVQEVESDFKDAHRDYDRETRNGKTLGATLRDQL